MRLVRAAEVYLLAVQFSGQNQIRSSIFESIFVDHGRRRRMKFNWSMDVRFWIYVVSIVIIAIENCRANENYVVESNEENGQLICRRCGHEIAGGKHLHRRVPSEASHRQRNDTIVGVDGVLIQLFENPAGERFEVIVAEKADVYHGGEAYSEDTWFPGYSWKIAQCPACGAHLGWLFEPLNQQCKDRRPSKTDDEESKSCDPFVGLVLDYLLSADFASSLTLVPKPKTFRSY